MLNWFRRFLGLGNSTVIYINKYNSMTLYRAYINSSYTMLYIPQLHVTYIPIFEYNGWFIPFKMNNKEVFILYEGNLDVSYKVKN